MWRHLLYHVGAMMKRLPSPLVLAGLAVWAGALGLYVATLAPTLTWGYRAIGADGGELLAAASSLGVPHPPGYPTYTLLLWLFAKAVPIGDFAYRGNLLSAVLASSAVGLLYWAILRYSKCLQPYSTRLVRGVSATLGATIFATSPLLWSQSTITEVYALNALFAVALLVVASHLALRLPGEVERDVRYVRPRLALFAFLLGLGLGNHLTLLAIAVPLLAWVWFELGTRKLVHPWGAIGLILGLAVYVYLPLRAAQTPPVNWGDADTLSGFWWMLTGRVYQDYVFGVPAGTMPARIVDWLELVFSQFNPLGLFFGLSAVVPLWRKLPYFLGASLTTMVLLIVYSISYHTVDSEVLLIAAFPLFSLWIALGFQWVLPGLLSTVRQMPRGSGLNGVIQTWLTDRRLVLLLSTVSLAMMPATSIALNYGSQDLSDDTSAFDHAREIFDSVPDGSVVMSRDERNAFALWYMRFVEDTDRDLATVTVPLLQFDWYWEETHDRFPTRLPPTPVGEPVDALLAIAERNQGVARLFFTYWHPVLEELFELTPVGPVFEATLR